MWARHRRIGVVGAWPVRGMIVLMSAQGVLLVCRREVDLVRVASAACCHAA